MKTFAALLFLALGAIAVAEMPKPAPNTRYAQLWTDSPFTTKPPPPESAPEVNPLEDYALAGVSPIPGGHRVTIINKKNPEERIYIPDPAKPDFKILSIQYGTDPMATTVRLAAGSKTGTVSVDEKLLVLKAAPPPQQPQQQQQQNMPPGTIPQPPAPGQPNAEAVRQPRPRVVPPAPNGAPQTAPQPQLNPQPQIQQQQQQRPNGQQRLNRR